MPGEAQLAVSAFVHEGGFVTREWFVLTVLLAAAEWSWGCRRLIWVFVARHVGATLIVAAALSVGIALGSIPRSVAHSSDVGTSYGMMAVGAALIAAAWTAAAGVGNWLGDTGAALLSGRAFTAPVTCRHS